MPKMRRRDDCREEAERDAAGLVGDEDGDVGAERKHRRMRDVEDAQHAVDQGQAHGHHGVHASEDEARYGKVDVVHDGCLSGAARLPSPLWGGSSPAKRRRWG